MAKTSLEKQIDELEKLKARGVLNEDEYAARRSALVAAVGAEPEGTRGGGIFKWGFLGCLGIFAVIGIFFIVVIVVIAAAIGSSADTADDGDADVHVSLAANASGVIAPEGNGSKKSKVTILSMADPAPATFTSPPAGKRVIGFDVEVENVGTQQVTSLDWKLRDSKNQEYGRSFFSGAGEPLDSYHDLTPGGKVRGWVFFEIDAEATVQWLRADPNPFLAHDLYFDIP